MPVVGEANFPHQDALRSPRTRVPIGFQIATISLEDFEFNTKRGLEISGSKRCSQ